MESRSELPIIRTADEAAAALSAYAYLRSIHVIIAGVDGRNRLIGTEIVHIGTETEYLLSISAVQSAVAKMGCIAYFLGITHPWGNATPTPDDIFYGRKLKNASLQTQQNLLDIVIVGHEEFHSFTASEEF